MRKAALLSAIALLALLAVVATAEEGDVDRTPPPPPPPPQPKKAHKAASAASGHDWTTFRSLYASWAWRPESLSLSLAAVPQYAKSAAAKACALSTVALDVFVGCVPPAVRPLGTAFLHGALSAVWVGHSLSAEAAGGVPATITTPLDAVTSFTTHKFLVSLGAMCTELLILRLIYREPHNNRRNNKLQRVAATPLGWLLLVALLTFPFGIPLGVLVVCVARLSDSLYTPAIVVGNILRPYAVAGVRACPYVAGIFATYTSRWGKENKAHSGSGCCAQVAEGVLWLAVLGAVAFLSAVRSTVRDPCDADVESDEEEEAPAVVGKKPKRKSK